MIDEVTLSGFLSSGCVYVVVDVRFMGFILGERVVEE